MCSSDLFKCFCDKLMIALPDVNIWAAGMQTVNVDGMETVIFNIPLRSPPVVIREVTRAIEREGKCSNYRPGAFPSPTDGPPIKYISHKEGQPNLPDELRHTGRWPRNCRRCGHDLAGILRELNVGHLGMLMHIKGKGKRRVCQKGKITNRFQNEATIDICNWNIF